MKIKGIDNLDIGMSNIEIEGEVAFEMSPKHIEGDNERGHYDFYSQFVVIDDGTGKIGCGVSIEKEEYRLKKGVVARIKGKFEEYKDKKGEMVKKLQGKLIAISKGDKITDVQQEVAEGYFNERAKINRLANKNEAATEVQAHGFDGLETVDPMYKKSTEKPIDKNAIWEAKDLRIARECSVKAVTELVCAGIIKGNDTGKIGANFFCFADTIVKYIYNGNQQQKAKPKGKPATAKKEKLALARHLANAPGKLELKEGHTGLLGEEKEPGSNPENAIPFKGKKKALKKVSEAEDFVNESDYIDPSDLPE